MEWPVSDYIYVWWLPAYWHYQLAWRTAHNILIFSITAQRTSSRSNEIALFMSDGWESRADVSFSMNFRVTDATPCIELLPRMQEFGWGDAPSTKDACTGGGELPADGWHTAPGVHLSYPGRTFRWLYIRETAHCRAILLLSLTKTLSWL